jgi:hypothetical protein
MKKKIKARIVVLNPLGEQIKYNEHVYLHIMRMQASKQILTE